MVIQNNKKKNSTRVLDIDEIKDMIKVLEKDKSIRALRNEVIILLLSTTGIKASELINLKIGDVGVFNGVDVIEIKRRNGIYGRISISKELRKVILKYLLSRQLSFVNKELPLIVNHSSNAKSQNEPLTGKGINVMLKKVAEKAGIGSANINSRCLRHTFAVDSLEIGISIRDVQETMGHAFERTTYIYKKTMKRITSSK